MFSKRVKLTFSFGRYYGKRHSSLNCNLVLNGDRKMGSTKQFGQLLNVDLSTSTCCLSAFPEAAKK